MSIVGRSCGFLIGLAVAVAAGSALAAEPPLSATLLADATLRGVQASARQGLREGKATNAFATCALALRPEPLVPTFVEAIRANWSADETVAIEKFLRTPVGQKYAKVSLLKVSAMGGNAPPEPIPEYSASESQQLAAFQHTPGGHQFMERNGFESEATRNAIRDAILQMLKTCKPG